MGAVKQKSLSETMSKPEYSVILKLKEYIKNEGVKKIKIAEDLGYTSVHLSRVLSEEHNPSAKMRHDILTYLKDKKFIPDYDSKPDLDKYVKILENNGYTVLQPIKPTVVCPKCGGGRIQLNIDVDLNTLEVSNPSLFQPLCLDCHQYVDVAYEHKHLNFFETDF